MITGFFQQVLQVQVQLVFDDDAQHPQGGPTQGVGVLGAAGFLADTEDAHQGIDLVGQRHGHAGLALRQLVASETWQVLFVQRLGYLVRLTFQPRQIETHDALHGVELAHHLAVQVGLAQFTGQFCLFGIATNLLGDKGGQATNAGALVGHGAQLLLEHHIGEPLAVLGQSFLAVVVVKEGRIRQTGTNHLLVTVDHLLGILGLDIADGDKAGHQFAVAVQHGEILLVLFHGADQGFLGHTQEVLIEATHQGHGPFHQRGDFVEQVRVDLCGAAGFFAGGDGLLFNHGLAASKVGDHMTVFFHAFGVLAGSGQLDSAGGMEPVAVTGAAGLQIQQLERHHLVTEQGHQPVGRAHKLHLAFAPAHALGDRQFLYRLGNEVGNQLGGGFALLGDLGYQALPFSGVLAAQLIHGQTQRGRKPLRGLGGVTVLVEGRLYGRTLAFDIPIRLLVIQATHQHSQPTWGGEAFYLTMVEAGFVQLADKLFCQRRTQGGQCLGGQLFGAQFNQ